MSKTLTSFIIGVNINLRLCFAIGTLWSSFSHTIKAQTKDLDSIRKEIKILKSKSNFSQKDTTFINLVDKMSYEFRFYNNDSLLHYCKLGLKLSNESDYVYGKSRFLLNMGQYYSDMGESDKAFEYYQKALTIATENDFLSLVASCQTDIGQEYERKGENAKALNVYLSTIELCKKTDNKVLNSVLTESIGALYHSQKDYSTAITWYEKVIVLNKEIGNPNYTAQTFSNLASIYNEIGKYDVAIFHVNNSIEIFEKIDKKDWLAFSYFVKGDSFLNKKNYQWARYWYEQALLLHESLDDDRGKAGILEGLSHVYFEKDMIKEAKKLALEAYAISKKTNSLKGQKNSAETLYAIEKKENNSEAALHFHEIFQKLSDSITKDNHKKNLSILKNKMEYEKQKQDLIVTNNQELAKQQGIINASLLVLLVFIITTFVVYRSVKNEKKLNKELEIKKNTLENREQELNDINETKDKLFSIIGHDLRGPVGALQSLLKLYRQGDVEREEFLGFIPKLNHDVDHIAFTLNNLLSWGQTQMNGTVTKPTTIALETLVNDNVNLLNEIAKNKSIKLISKVATNSLAWSDENQIDIVIRNLISNALKFTPENGMVTIDAQERNSTWIVSVRDTGIGIEKKVQKKLFSENSNVTTYGTNNEKGTGLGLSLCKEMVENNGGKIWLDSIPRKGSTFYFSIPKSTKKYEQAS